MKTTLVAALVAAFPFVAQASDLPSKKAPAAPAPMASNNWSGAYIGITGGYGWGASTFDDSSFVEPVDVVNYDLKANGGLVGGVAGYDWQLSNNMVFGILGDVSWANLSGDVCVEEGGCDASNTDSYANVSIDMLATARARLGFTFDKALIYATGGVAYATASSSISYAVQGLTISDDVKLFGWTIGGGIEYKINQNLSIGAEYLHIDFGSNVVNYSHPLMAPISIGVDTSTTVDLVRGSLIYRF